MSQGFFFLAWWTSALLPSLLCVSGSVLASIKDAGLQWARNDCETAAQCCGTKDGPTSAAQGLGLTLLISYRRSLASDISEHLRTGVVVMDILSGTWKKPPARRLLCFHKRMPMAVQQAFSQCCRSPLHPRQVRFTK